MSNLESKHDKFVRLAEKRVNNALKSIDLIGNLANKNNYDYNTKEAQKVISVLKESVSIIEKKFKNANKSTFRL